MAAPLPCQTILIWISAKAKPLAGKPYRWGTYVGITTGLLGIVFLAIGFSAADVYGKAYGAVFGLSAIVCCIGVLRPRGGHVAMKEKLEVVRGSGNAFCELGHENADAEQFKAIRRAEIFKALDRKHLNGTSGT